MAAKILKREGSKIIVEIEVDLSGNSMLDKEIAIREAVNFVGSISTEEALKSFDTDGKPIICDGKRMTSKGENTEKYECPYGNVIVSRHVYQSSAGGKTFCPLESSARMILNSTPAYAKMLSFKYAQNGGKHVAKDMLESHDRKVCPVYVKKVSDFIGGIAEIHDMNWNYEIPKLDEKVHSIAIGLDGTCMLMVESGWREAMAGTITLYNKSGERMYTIYTGAPPEYGKETFLQRFDSEIEKVKAAYPGVVYAGVADGAKENWRFLESRVSRYILDFYHAAEYVKLAANAIYFGKRKNKERSEWIEKTLHNLKHKHGAAKRLLNELNESLNDVAKKHHDDLKRAVTYFTNNYKKMNYARHQKDNITIGSGVTEAACKELIKQRMCNSGMRWKESGAAAVIAVRSLALTDERWSQFWNHITDSGCPEHKKFETV